jgi:hypothetical protein
MIGKVAFVLMVAAVVLVASLTHKAVSAPSYTVTLKCGAIIAEDEAAHLRLVDFDRSSDGGLQLVYRCRTNGY